ncbi:protein-export chaperone SecB [Suttonella sp. R2A3]|uniref:protein-export chaperone SecB n=1 Tax=Suttonella sp. R2A3 TaxID=2908648 RepID=UPI001F0201F3|nr:protein-export chaperone SecB [Suttonella sp. R2A3]UJF24103.1 protein-export chaperone SecB [Suttonella sp. R2A3]
MSDEKPQVTLEVRKLFVGDLSVEVPGAPEIFNEELNPEISFNVAFENQKLPPEHFYEVKLSLTVTAKSGDKVIYLVEVAQSGIFEIAGLEEMQLRHALNVYCTTLLYPYAREVVSSAINRAGFPSLFLQPVNFEGLFQQKLQQEAQQKTQEAAPADPEDLN